MVTSMNAHDDFPFAVPAAPVTTARDEGRRKLAVATGALLALSVGGTIGVAAVAHAASSGTTTSTSTSTTGSSSSDSSSSSGSSDSSGSVSLGNGGGDSGQATSGGS